jgi:hypothetical protein
MFIPSPDLHSVITKEYNQPLWNLEFINIFRLNLSLATKALRVLRVLMEHAVIRRKIVSVATKILNTKLLFRKLKVRFWEILIHSFVTFINSMQFLEDISIGYSKTNNLRIYQYNWYPTQNVLTELYIYIYIYIYV